MTQEAMIQAMVWYKKEDWDTLLTIFSDGHLLPPTYEHWLELAEKAQANVESQGHQVVKVFIDPETFPQWCEKKGMEPNAEARTSLAIEVVNMQNFSL